MTEKNKIIHSGNDQSNVSGMYKNWFLEYASYVILERAVPTIEDGFKPVQRRIMHALKEMDDGRYNKVANIIGQTMQYHPHGDASIGDAIVNIGQKSLLIDMQGNWGDVRTGDSAAAPRYIEARPSKFALEVLYNPQTTNWQLSYDGRKKEPTTLPVKFPLLLAHGVEGIAVGLSTKILPHNFQELIKASIDIEKGKTVKIYPDFQTGGMADFSDYKQGIRGGKIKIRATIEVKDNKKLIINSIPYGTTTQNLIESIIKANEKGKIKIKKVIDNTAKDVEIVVELFSGQSPDITIDALYAFTDCEVSISPNSCVIINEKPHFIPVNDILKFNTAQTKNLLTKELEIKREELLEKILFSSLERIFIENKIYRKIEECETWESVIQTIDRGLTPFKNEFYRSINQDDIVSLTEIKIKRISKFDVFKASEQLKILENELEKVNHHLSNISQYTIDYFNNLLEKFGKNKPRKTIIKSFDSIDTNIVAANNQKLYVNRADGFVGYGLKKEEFVSECSDIDDIIVIRQDGKMIVSKVSEKVFMGKNIVHVGVWLKGDDRMTYNMVYLDAKTGKSMVKRFNVTAITRDKEYDLTKGAKNSKVYYLSHNPNGEAEVITIKLSQSSRAKIKVFDYDFSQLDIKGRTANGNQLTKYPVRKIELKSKGVSTLKGLDIWYDKTIGKLNKNERGDYVGNFSADDKILIVYKNGSYEIRNYNLTNHFDAEKVFFLQKFDDQKLITTIYYDGVSRQFYIKKFFIETTTLNKTFGFISEESKSKLLVATTAQKAIASIEYLQEKNKKYETEKIEIVSMVQPKGWKAIGNKFFTQKIKHIRIVEEIFETTKNIINQNVTNSKDENQNVGNTIKLNF